MPGGRPFYELRKLLYKIGRLIYELGKPREKFVAGTFFMVCIPQGVQIFNLGGTMNPHTPPSPIGSDAPGYRYYS